MPDTKTYDLIIIGAGVSGLGAAIYAGRLGMKTLVIGESVGGTILNANEITNYAGFESISGIDLAAKLQKHAEQFKVEIVSDRVGKIDKSSNCFTMTATEAKYKSKSIIIATGTEWKKLNVPGEVEFKGKGIHYCALCDAPFYKGKTAAVIGGSDSSAKDAIILAEYAKKIYIISRKSDLTAEPINAQKVKSNNKISIFTETNVLEFKGGKFLQKMIVDKAINGSNEIIVDGVFIDIGHIPVSELGKGLGINVNEKDQIKLDRHGMTNVEGIFACGDVTDALFKQAFTGVAEGIVAAYNAYNFVKKVDINSCLDGDG